MLSAIYEPYALRFKSPVLTSRGSMEFKNGYFIHVTDGLNKGVGECSFIEGLSIDDLASYEAKLRDVCANISDYADDISTLVEGFPSIAFGLETALLDLKTKQPGILIPSSFTKGERGIPINGLIWMGDAAFMRRQIDEKLQQGFRCIKLKVGALDFSAELSIIEGIRKQYSKDIIELRLDANGAFTKIDVFDKLKQLAVFDIHSIEQPVQPKQFELMYEVCAASIIPVALDEELIGVDATAARVRVLDDIRPPYIILKPSLLGGFTVADEWIELAEQRNIDWWATSALESNIGLNAIAQWVAVKNTSMPQGLGTGGLFENNTLATTYIKQGALWYGKY